MARLSSIRLLASVAAECGMKIRQYDVETAYLNGHLEEEILMEPPKDLEEILQSIVDDGRHEDDIRKARVMLKNLREGNKVVS